MANRSREKLDIEFVTKPDGSTWVKLTLRKGVSYYPSFEDLFRQLHAVNICETSKYAGRVKKPSAFIVRFLNAAIAKSDGIIASRPSDSDHGAAYENAWQELSKDFKLPPRVRQPVQLPDEVIEVRAPRDPWDPKPKGRR